MELNQTNKNTANETGKQVTNEVISVDECKKFLDKFNLNEQDINQLRNFVVGVVDRTFTTYLDSFK